MDIKMHKYPTYRLDTFLFALCAVLLSAISAYHGTTARDSDEVTVSVFLACVAISTYCVALYAWARGRKEDERVEYVNTKPKAPEDFIGYAELESNRPKAPEEFIGYASLQFYKPMPVEQAACRHCGVVFVRRAKGKGTSAGRPQLYCRPQCLKKFHNARRAKGKKHGV